MNDVEKEFLEDENSQKIKPTRKKSLNSKKKGNSFERDVAKLLSDRFKKEFRRTFFSGAFTGGKNEERSETMTEDQKLMVVGDIKVPSNFLFSIECKARKEAKFWDLFNASSEFFSWFKQAESDAVKVKKYPMIVVKYNNKDLICFVSVGFPKILPVFSIGFWNCFWLKDVLSLPDNQFFSGN